jgi:hypothetical protein
MGRVFEISKDLSYGNEEARIVQMHSYWSARPCALERATVKRAPQNHSRTSCDILRLSVH